MASSGRKPKSLFDSPIVRKLLTGITGLALTLFVIIHMIGNLTFFSANPNAYNEYSHTLLSLGPLLYIVELGLVAVVLVHIVLGVRIYLGKQAARPIDYAEYHSAGEPSRQTISSRSMIVTGVILGAFLVFHVMSFKYGPGLAEGYVITADGVMMRDLKRLMVETFQNPLFAFGYPAIMILLAFHLRHGIWSALQSLGAMSPRLTPVVYAAGGILAALIAIGFLVLPLWIFFSGGMS
ncbi:MAG: succinate dehydrogenase cytochrome b subunit [Rhodothermales bacterium]|nr:succinate dehydrogenase cytochrome b subunit [Rhodothermales bacterium]